MFLALKNGLGRLAIFFRGLLDEYGGAAAAYSLRKLSGSYSGFGIKIRRASDDLEANVALPVTANSAITVTSGSSSATTLGGILTESVNTYASDYSAGVDGWVTTGAGTLAGNIDGIGGRDDNLRFTSANADISVNSYHRRNNVLELGQTYNVTFDFYIPSSNARLDQIKSIQIGSQTIDLSSLTALDQWVSASATSTIGATANNIVIRWEDSSESGDATGDVSYIRNVSVNAVGHNATVVTWYDQAGSNDATQGTAGNQPKIAEAGALLADGIDFDGTDDHLECTSALGITTDTSVFTVLKLDTTAVTQFIIDNRDGNGDGSLMYMTSVNFSHIFEGNSPIAQVSASTDESLVIYEKTTSAVEVAVNDGTPDSRSNTNSIDVTTAPVIGARSFGSASNPMDGSIKEIVIYSSVQTANRSDIIDNINDHYSIF